MKLSLMRLAAIVLLAACDRSARKAPASDADLDIVRITARAGSIEAADSLRPGWRRIHVEEVDGGHIVVLFRLADGTAAPGAVADFVAALDTAAATPSAATAIGGFEGGASGDVVVHLTPGAYVLVCVRRGEDGHRHAHRGEATTLTVRTASAADSAFASPPPSTQSINMVDFAYVGPDQWTRGAQFLRLENTGQQDHQLRLARLRDGATLQAWMTADDPATVATAVAGMARVGPGEVAYLPVDLTPGAYVAYCLVPDGKSRQPHVEMGMFRQIRVP